MRIPFLSRCAGAGRFRPTVPDGTRVYVIGDIHGRADLLSALLGQIAEDARAAPAAREVAVFLGDYYDRGLQSREVLERLLADPLPGFESVYLKGNHDAMALAFLDDPQVGPDWFAIGGQATLYSYGVEIPADRGSGNWLETASERFRRALPPAHLRFLQALRLWHEEGNYVFVHAGIRPDVALAEQSEEDLMWMREPFLSADLRGDRMIVHGHTVTDAPDVRRGRIGIDTGAYATGRLTCLVLGAAERRFLHT